MEQFGEALEFLEQANACVDPIILLESPGPRTFFLAAFRAAVAEFRQWKFPPSDNVMVALQLAKGNLSVEAAAEATTGKIPRIAEAVAHMFVNRSTAQDVEPEILQIIEAPASCDDIVQIWTRFANFVKNWYFVMVEYEAITSLECEFVDCGAKFLEADNKETHTRLVHGIITGNQCERCHQKYASNVIFRLHARICGRP